MANSQLEFGRVFVDRRDVAIVGFHELMVVVYRDEISVPILQAVADAQKALRTSYGSIAGLTVLSEKSLVRPKDEVRDFGQGISLEFDQFAYASAIVLRETGIRGAVYRSILTGIHMASRRPVQQKVFADVQTASSWISEINPSSALTSRATEIYSRVDQLQRAFN